MHLVGFIIRIYDNARSPERQNLDTHVHWKALKKNHNMSCVFKTKRSDIAWRNHLQITTVQTECGSDWRVLPSGRFTSDTEPSVSVSVGDHLYWWQRQNSLPGIEPEIFWSLPVHLLSYFDCIRIYWYQSFVTEVLHARIMLILPYSIENLFTLTASLSIGDIASRMALFTFLLTVSRIIDHHVDDKILVFLMFYICRSWFIRRRPKVNNFMSCNNLPVKMKFGENFRS